MFSSTKKVLWLIAGVILAGGVSIYISAEEIFLSPNLANPIQKIQKIMFVDPVGNGGTWKTTGQVEVTARSNRVTINGSLVTNVENGNSVWGTGLKNSSLLGGVGNKFPTAVVGSAIVGGKNNEIKSDTATILGGDGNSIDTSSVRSTIIGGQRNKISTGNSTIIGGSNNAIWSVNAVILGGNGNQVNGANSLAGGGGAIVGGEGTFAWSDGSFSVSKEHLFAVNANNGVAVSTGSPNTIAALTINGDLRIQQYTSDTSSCNDKTLGTIKSVVASGNQLCACFCDGNGWQAVLDTPKCVKACPDPRNNLTLQCNTALWAATSESDYKHKFEPAWTGEILTGTVGCLTGWTLSGFVLPQFSYKYDGSSNGFGTSYFYRTCVQPDKAEKVSCNVSYKCNTVSSLDLSKAAVCPWEGNNTGDVKKDDRGLRQNVATTLTGTIGRTCKDASSTKERINNPIDQNKSCTNSNSPDPDFDQSLKCQFYCPNGWHKEGEEGASQKCVENSCGKQNYTRIETPGNRSVTYDVPCLDNTQNATVSTTVTIEDGKTIYTNTFMCELGELTEEVGSCTQESTTCNPYYHTDATCSCPPNTCSTTTMTNATLCPRDNDAGTVPSHNMTSTIVNFCDSNPNKKCEFICNPYYTPDSATSCRPFICIGETPTNASVCPGDENQLTADTSRTLQGSCGNAKCEYTCNNGYENRGSTCVRVYDVVSKVTSVAHHTCQNATSCPSGYTLIAGAKYGQHCGTMNADNRWTKICYNGETSKKAEGEPCIYIWTAWWFTSPTAIVWDKKSDTDITALLLYLWGLTTGDPITAWLWNALLGDENIDITASTVFKKGVVSANWSCVAQEDFINISNRITLKDEANTYNIGTWSL